jgi:polar amino acid transport system substrate-binding protein
MKISNGKTFAGFLIFSLFLLTACQIPQDPNRTLENVRNAKVLRVGIIVNEPWVVKNGGEPTGVEPALIGEFAGEIGARPVWVTGSDYELFESLKNFELDLVIGGLAESSPYGSEVAFTNPYYTEKIFVGVSKEKNPPPEDLSGQKVSVRTGEIAAFYLKEKGAVPVPAENPFETDGLAAAPEWELEQNGFQKTGEELYQIRHIVAVPPGENLWLVRLDNFLAAKRSQIEKLLAEEMR